MFNEYENLKKYSYIFQFNNSPICLHMGIFSYAYIWEHSHMLYIGIRQYIDIWECYNIDTYGNIPIC